MTTTLNIPKGTVPVGTHTIGPRSVPAGMSSFALDVQCSQTVAPGNSFHIGIQRSFDGGVTWEEFSGGDGVGTYPDPADLNMDWSCSAAFRDPNGPYQFAAMQVQAVITVIGTALAITGGTLTVTT